MGPDLPKWNLEGFSVLGFYGFRVLGFQGSFRVLGFEGFPRENMPQSVVLLLLV